MLFSVTSFVLALFVLGTPNVSTVDSPVSDATATPRAATTFDGGGDLDGDPWICQVFPTLPGCK